MSETNDSKGNVEGSAVGAILFLVFLCFVIYGGVVDTSKFMAIVIVLAIVLFSIICLSVLITSICYCFHKKSLEKNSSIESIVVIDDNDIKTTNTSNLQQDSNSNKIIHDHYYISIY